MGTSSMRTLVLGLLLCCCLAEARAATQFPYDALIQADDVEVRSGPGLNYYATGKLKTSDRVTVHRHDPGGWYMISPPPGSFSYLDARFVQRQGERGVVQIPPNDDGTLPRALVRIGSQLGDDHTFYGRQLNNGDEVQILGERTLATDRGAATMLMITPPPREYRWVKGDFLIGADASLRQQKAADPYADPLVQTGARAPMKPAVTAEAEAAPLSMPARAVRSSDESMGTSDSVSQSRAAMKEVDRKYLDMVALPPVEWDIGSIEKAYKTIRDTAPPEIAESIDSRIQALAERRKIQDDFQDFAKLTSTTTQRDAELAAQQGSPQVPADFANVDPNAEFTLDPVTGAPAAGAPAGTPPGLPVVTNAPGAAPLSVPTSAVQGQPPIPGAQMVPVTPRGQVHPTTVTPQPGAPPAGPTLSMSPSAGDRAPVTPQLNGAGIVQHAPARPGTPRYMLIAPSGKFLSYLDAGPGVNLEGAVGQSMGLVGRRFYEPKVRAEMILVRQMVPVQLQ